MPQSLFCRRWDAGCVRRLYRVCVSFSIANKLTISTFAEFAIWIATRRRSHSASLWCSGALGGENLEYSCCAVDRRHHPPMLPSHSVTNLFMGITYANRIVNALFHKPVCGGGDGETMKNGFRSLCWNDVSGMLTMHAASQPRHRCRRQNNCRNATDITISFVARIARAHAQREFCFNLIMHCTLHAVKKKKFHWSLCAPAPQQFRLRCAASSQ